MVDSAVGPFAVSLRSLNLGSDSCVVALTGTGGVVLLHTGLVLNSDDPLAAWKN